MKKKALLDATVQPVNKYHLAGGSSLTSAVEALCSTHALSVCEDEVDELMCDDDAEGSMVVTFQLKTRTMLMRKYNPQCRPTAG